MVTSRRAGVRTAALLGLLCGIAAVLPALTVEQVPLERLARESGIIVRGIVMTTGARWEGNTIHTTTTVRVTESLKGAAGTEITVTQLGGTVGEVTAEIPGTPVLRPGDDVVLFLTPWQGKNWIHSIVLGKFSVTTSEGVAMAVNDLRNIGLVDPVTGREVTEGEGKEQRFLLPAFLERIRTLVAAEAR